MTTAADPISQPVESVVARRPRRLLRFLGAVVLGVLATIAIAGAGVLAFDAIHEARILPGVHAGSVDLSGLDRQQAATVLTSAYSAYANGRVVVHTDAGDVSIPYRDVGRRPDVEPMIDAALAVGRSGNAIERAFGEPRVALNGSAIDPRVTFDDKALVARIASGVASLERRPIDATIAVGSDGIVTTQAIPGLRFDPSAAEAAAVQALGQTDAPAEVAVDATTVPVQAAVTDDTVQTAKAAAERMLGDVVVAHGSKTFTIPAATVLGWLQFESAGGGGAIDPALDATWIPPALDAVAKAVAKPPVEATYLVGKGGVTVGVTASQDGEQLDVPATAAEIAQAMTERAHGASPASITAVMVAVAPKLSTDEARKQAPLMVRLSTWKTWFPISERNHFGANIWLPARFINGTILRPGERFEWFDAVGPITAARGFGLGGVIVRDHTEPTGAIGGGMCSSSTTLFNAALRAGLQMGARTNHSYYINRYPVGLDATVTIKNGSTTTMSFTNDMAHPILIRGYKVVGSGGRGWVRYEIWGIPDGRTVSVGQAVVTNVQKATTITVPVTTLRKGVRNQTEFPSDGMDTSVTRVVRDHDGRVIHTDTYLSHYKLWNGRIEVGA